ncbi:S8 family serine peptidase [Aurantibacillus circumpalustris]|uniref:S8 family serine peptidase n=1 Tax=Aurantibacillus circumpalustris TaxID=3036359 RepID=UPI00295B9F99|nr:S8 family serine peptidase [Aurantibacillus circumpalustris]
MKKKLTVLILLSICFNLGYSQTVFDKYVDGRVYVKFRKASLKAISHEDPKNIPLAKLGVIKELISKHGITKAHMPFYQVGDDDNLPFILKLEFSKINQVNTLIEDLTQITGVEYAEKVSLNKTDITPNDALFASVNGSTHLNQINAQNAWNVFSGNSNITVAIVDNAVMNTHVDLIGNTYTNTLEAGGITGVDDDGNGYIDDINGYDVAGMDGITSPTALGQDHGTHCAGIAGASSNNSIGVASIGWGIKIIPVKCSFDNSAGSIVDLGYEGILYAVKAKAKIISCSWGNNTGGFSQTEQYVIDYAWNRGCIIIASAGNANTSTPNYPGAYNHVYCVAAVDASDIKWSLSNYGTWVDICAPGNNILSTVPYSGTPAYVSYSGTSMSTPMVAGLAGLMLSKSPGMTRSDVLNCISNTAVNIYSLSGNSSYVSGNLLGAGRIDAFAAMNCAATYSALPPVANFYAFLPNTCPNVSIPFVDSSLYFPTSWSWTFQGGTPATSTSSNPSVMWATPGNYSVSLTVTNGNGSNAKTKLSYVTVSNPQSLPFSEGFQATTFLPTNWVANNIWNDNLYWQRTTTAGGFGTSTACAMFDNFTMNAPGERDEMRTPKFNFSNVANARLRFDVAYARYDATFSDSLEVKVSTNCGTTWTSIYLKGGTGLATKSDQSNQFVPTSTQWRRDTIDISIPTAGQGNVSFSFINRGHYGQPIYLDNINLVFPTPTLNVGTSPTVCIGLPYTFTNTSLSASDYTWSLPGGSPATSTSSNPSVSYATAGNYTFNILGVNGTSTASITRTITVVAAPNISITASPGGSICAGATVTLSASGADSYSWSAGPVNNPIQVSPLVSTIYTVIGSNPGCVNIQTVSVVVGVPNFTVTVTANSTTLCSGSIGTLTATGANSYTWNGLAGPSSIMIAPSTTTTYTIIGSDNSCLVNAFVTVTVIPKPVTAVSFSDALCDGECNGVIDAITASGPGPYSYSLNNSQCTSLPCTNLCAGLYTITTTDNASGCSSMDTFTIESPSPLQSIVSSTNLSCPNCQDGAISVAVNGGIAPYTYNWIPSGGISNTNSQLASGCYTVIITDANTCASSADACIAFNTGIQSPVANSNILIYPNPAKANVSVEFAGFSFDIKLYDALGRLMIDKKSIKDSVDLELREFPRGVYLLEISTGKEKLVKKLVLD